MKKKIRVEIVMIAVLLLIVVILFVELMVDSNKESDNKTMTIDTSVTDEETEINSSNKYEYSKEPTIRTTTTTTKREIPMSEWGFYNSDDWGNRLVKIEGNPNDITDQTYDDFNEEYVIITEGSEFWYFYPDSKQFAQGSFYFSGEQISMSSSYVVVNNDMMSAPSLGGAFAIDERIVVGDIVIFRRGHNYYIPYDMLDLNRVEFYKEDGRFDDYKVYLK